MADITLGLPVNTATLVQQDAMVLALMSTNSCQMIVSSKYFRLCGPNIISVAYPSFFSL